MSSEPQSTGTSNIVPGTIPSSSMANADRQTGIDITKALDILSMRAYNDDHDHSHSEGCHAHKTEELASMGQTIDLTANTLAAPDNTTDQDTAEASKQQEERRKQRCLETEQKLKSMSVLELLHAVTNAQQQRVAAYQEYNESLNQVLQSGNMTTYLASCAHATAAFAVLSDTINGVRAVLGSSQHNRSDLQKLLIGLQKHEKEKLNLTAAFHLERIRERNENIGQLDNADKRISRLLKEGVQSLKTKIDNCIEEINEVMEEIRYALLEEGESDDEE